MSEELKQAAQQPRKQTPVLSGEEVRHYATCCVNTEDAIRAAEQKVLERALTAAQPAQAGERDTGPRVLREVFALCDDTLTKMESESNEFSRGRAFEAKGISRAIGAWFQDEFCGRSHMGEPVIQPAAQADSMGMPTSCGKPLCSPDEHHPLCKLHQPAAQATPEPVGEPAFWHFRNKEGPCHWQYPSRWPQTDAMLSEMDKAFPDRAPHENYPLYTRPAPGVPEGWQPIQTAPTDGTKFLGWRRGQVATSYRVPRDDCEMWCFGGTSGAFEHWPETRPEFWMPHPPEPSLAAAQAKGVDYA